MFQAQCSCLSSTPSLLNDFPCPETLQLNCHVLSVIFCAFVLTLLQEGVYYRIGQLMAMALVHGGAAVHLISQSLYNFLTGMKPCDIIVGVHEIPDASVREMLQMVCNKSFVW